MISILSYLEKENLNNNNLNYNKNSKMGNSSINNKKKNLKTMENSFYTSNSSKNIILENLN